MREAVLLHNRHVVALGELNHLADESGNEQRHVAAGHVRGIDAGGERLQTCTQSFQGPAALVLIARDDHAWWQFRQLLVHGRHDNDRRDDLAEQPYHPLQHRLGSEGQQRLRGAHARGLAAGEHDASV